MAGIGYTDSVMLYIKEGSGAIGDALKWYGVRIDNVRIELIEAKNMQITGLKDVNKCTFKVYDTDLPLPYSASPDTEHKQLTFKAGDFFAICKKADLNIDISLPEGLLSDNEYESGLFEYVSSEYGMAYMIKTIDHYSLIPQWHIGGS